MPFVVVKHESFASNVRETRVKVPSICTCIELNAQSAVVEFVQVSSGLSRCALLAVVQRSDRHCSWMFMTSVNSLM